MDTSVKFLLIQELELFSCLSNNELNTLAQSSSIKNFKKEHSIYTEGELIANVYVLQKGSVKMGSHFDTNKSIIKQLVHEGELFGENIMGSDPNRADFAQTLSEAQVLIIPKKVFEDLLISNTIFGTKVVSHILKRLGDLEQRIADFVYKKAQKRIENFLMRLANKKGIKIGLDEILIKHSLSHSDIAYVTDTSRQTVSRVLGDLKRSNVIHFSARKPNKILIRDIASLA